MKQLKKKIILVVEDEKFLIAAIKTKLAYHGFEVLMATNIDEALVQMQHEGIKAIWLDHYLTGEATGLDFVKILKNTAKWKHIPIFVVTNTATDEKKSQYLELGVQEYYVKADSHLSTIIEKISDFLGS